MNNKTIVKIENLKKYFYPHSNLISSIMNSKKLKPVKAINDISFNINEGEIFALIGESGSGKTTVAKALMKLINIDGGNIYFNDKLINNINKDELLAYRSDVQMIFQDPYASMNPRFKIKDVLLEPLKIHKIELSKSEYEDKIMDALDSVKISTNKEFLYRYPHMLSGGQRQRVATARSLILNPKLIIADEPVSMIDLSTRAEILYMLKELRNKKNISFLYITHDLSTAKYFADTIAVMYLGKIVEIGKSDEIIDNPKHPYTKALIEAVPKIDFNSTSDIKEISIKESTSNSHDVSIGCAFFSRCLISKEECKNYDIDFQNITDSHKVACINIIK